MHSGPGSSTEPDDPSRPSAGILPLNDRDDAYRRLIESLTDHAVILLGPDGTVLSWNPGAEAIKGYSAAEIVGQNFERFHTAEARAGGHPQRVLEAAAAGGSHNEEGWRMRKDGSRFWARVLITALHDPDGKLEGFGIVTVDLTARKRHDERLARVLAKLNTDASTDSLTGLSNRRGWDDTMAETSLSQAIAPLPVCVAMIDLDNFKAVNDERGHHVGDKVLTAAAGRWRDTLRVGDVIARHGGEEFAVLLPNCGLECALEVIERLRAATPAPLSCSAGVAEWAPSETPDEALERADGAMYRAKAEGRDRTVIAGPPRV